MGGDICISEVIGISPGNLDSSQESLDLVSSSNVCQRFEGSLVVPSTVFISLIPEVEHLISCLEPFLLIQNLDCPLFLLQHWLFPPCWVIHISKLSKPACRYESCRRTAYKKVRKMRRRRRERGERRGKNKENFPLLYVPLYTFLHFYLLL